MPKNPWGVASVTPAQSSNKKPEQTDPWGVATITPAARENAATKQTSASSAKPSTPPSNAVAVLGDEYARQLRANFAHNQPYAKSGPYFTQLPAAQEKQFRQWVAANNINFDPDAKIADYDMRGFWLARQNGKAPQTAINEYDNKLHFTDKFKTPYDRTFSNESRYAKPDAPHWVDGRYLVTADGRRIFDQAHDTEDSPYPTPAKPSLALALPHSSERNAPIAVDLSAYGGSAPEPTSPPRNSRAPKYTPEETQARLNNLKHGKRIVPVGEDVYRHVASAASNMEGAVALLGMPFATAADTAYSLATGEPTSAAADWYAGHAVKPLFDSAKQIAIDPHHEQETIAGQVLGTAAAMGVNLAPAIMTGGVSGALEAAPEVTALAAANGFSIPVTIERFNQLVGAGVDYQTAAKVAAKDYGINTVMGLVPASKAGKPLTRFVTGAPVGPLAYAAQTKAERDSLNRQYPRLAPHFEWKEAGRSGLLTGAMGLLFGARAKLPAGAESKPINAEELYGKEEADEPPDNQGPPPNAPEISKNDLIQQAKARLSELEERANGAPDRRIPGPNGKMITVRGKQPQFFTSEAEQAELRFLRNNADNADALARVYGLRIREPNAGTAEPAQNDILRYQFDDGRQIKVQPLDEATFVQYVRPRLKPDESGYSLSEYRAAHPDVNAVALARAPGRYWQLVRLGNQATLKPTAESLKSAREVTGFAAVDNPKPRARPEHALKGKNVVVDGLEGVWNVKNVLGRDNLALLESPDGTRRAAKVDQLIPVVEAPADKRVNEVAAKRVVDMSGAEKDQALLTDTKTGIGNDRAFRETGSRTVGIADLDGLKYVNDTFGHHAGDALIQAAADALDKHSGGRAYRLHGGGDEFAVRAESRAEAQTALDAANEALGKTVFHFERPDGRHEIVRNLGFSYGTGKNEAIADRRLGEHKDTRTRQGLRSARGEAPSGDMGAPAQGHEGVDGAAGRDDGGSGREALDYFDPRLKRADYREALKVDARELTPGGNMGLIGGSFSRDFDPAAYDRTPRDQEAPVQRLPSTNPDWFQQLASEEGVSVKQVQNAIDKALAGDQLGKRQQRIVTGLLDGYEAERTEPERLNQRRRQLEQARQLRQSVKDKGGVAAKGSDFEAESEWARYIDNHPGEALAEGEYDPSLDGEARALQELQKEAEQSEPDAVETLVERLALGKLSEPAAARELWAIIENARRSHENTDARRSGDQGLPRQTAGHVAEPERREAVSENDARSENRPSREVAQRNETAAPAAAEETPLTPPERSSLELSPAEQRAPVEKAPDTEQTDLIGGKTETQQAVYDETLRRDRARNSGQLETETGDASDLFSQARQQTDLTDYPPPESESQPAETAPSKEGVVVSGKRSSESAPKEAESIPVDAGRQPVPGRTLVKRWAGARGSGFTEASARIERRKRARAEPQFDWDVAALEGEPGRYVVRAFEQKPARTGVSASGARPSNKAEAPLPPQREYTRDVATEMRPTGSESEATPAASGVTETAPTDAAYYYVNGELGLARTGFTRDESRWITFTPDEARRMAAGDITPHGGGQRHGVFVGVDSGRRMPSEPAILNNSSDTGADNGGTTEQLRPVGPAAHDRASAEALPGAGEKRDVRPGDEGQAGTGRAGDAQSRRGRLQSRHGVGSGEEPLSDAGAGSQRHGSEPGAGREPHRPSDQDVVADAESGAGGLRAGERVSNAGNYVITDADALGAGGAKTHADQNLAAIKILKALESRGARATPEEQAVLVKYTGWGGLPQIFDEAKGDWAARRDQLKSLVTDEEYAAARRSTQDAHYTSADVIRAIYAALDRLGVQGGRVLEPAVGTGHFFGLMPKKLRARTRLTGIELDPITGGIAKLLYPKAGINAPLAFQDAKLPDGAFDLALGNPPFGSNKITDRLRKHLSGQSIHNYFFGKSVDTLADDGVLAMVVSHHLMDKADSRDRAALAKRTRLLGAIRLPETAFKANAGTEVTTDIIILQKRKPDEDAGEAWTAVATVDDPAGGEPISVNEYFARHPEMMAGEMARKGTMYGPDQPTLLAKDDRTLAGVLEGIVQKLPEHAVKPLGDLEAKRPAVPEKRPALQLDDLDASDIKPYSFFELPDGRIAQRDPDTEGLDADGNIVTEQHWHVREGWVDKKAERARRLIKLHQSARRLLTLERTDADDKTVRAEMNRLNRLYDQYRKKYGYLHQAGTRNIFREDPEWPLLLSLEKDFDPAVTAAKAKREGIESHPASAEKADIFFKRVNAPHRPVEHVDNAADALTASLAERGVLDLDYMGAISNQSPDSLMAELGERVLDDPSAGWQTADAYLSGDVKTKLFHAKQAAQADADRYQRNVTALEAVQPADIAPVDISVRPGSGWVPGDVMADFARHLFGEHTRARATYLPGIGEWSIDIRNPGRVESTSRWGTERMSGDDILTRLMNGRNIRVTRPNPDNPKSRMTDPDATAAALEKANAITTEFTDWLWRDAERRDALAKIYNDTYNTHVERAYDGAHLGQNPDGSAGPLPGASPLITLRPHQKNAIWRFLQTGGGLADHTVGSGKAQPLDAKVLTPAGWTRMGDIRSGDQVIAADGSATVVEGVYPQGDKDIFRVVFSDGSSTECCEEHLWLTHTYKERTASQQAAKQNKHWPCAQPKVRSLAEIRETLKAPHLGAKNHRIPMVSPVEFDERPLMIPPYLLGVLLGDGNFTQGNITVTTPDVEVIDACRAVLPSNARINRIQSGERCPVWSFVGRDSSIRQGLKTLGLQGKYSHEKFVPENYLFNSVDNRLELLRGLMDTDGYVEHKGYSTNFCTTSPALRDAVIHLSQSLGGLATVTEKNPRFSHNGESKQGRLAYVLRLTLPPEINPFKLPRKADAVVPKSRYTPARYIVAVESIGRQPAQCIRVAHPSHLYVTDDFIVTHNTMMTISTLMEGRRMGFIKKPLVAVPNHLVDQWGGEIVRLYPDAKVLIASKRDFEKSRRRRFVSRIATGDWDMVVMGHPSFELIKPPTAALKEITKEQTDDVVSAIKQLEESGEGKGLTVKQLEKKRDNLNDNLKAQLEAKDKDNVLTYDELGADFLVVDESQEYKNLAFSTRMGRDVSGLGNTAGSQRAMDMYVKVRHTQNHAGGKHVLFLTGTPISNSLAEMYTLQRYLQHDEIRARGLDHFDAWANVFAEKDTQWGLDATGANYKLQTRLGNFVNLPELVGLYRSFADVVTRDDLERIAREQGKRFPIPKIAGGKPENVIVERSPEQAAYMEHIVERAMHPPRDPSIDNMLKITNDARKMALDMRLVNPIAADFEGSKTNVAADKIKAIHDRWAKDKGTQLVFLDLSTPKGSRTAEAARIQKLVAAAEAGDSRAMDKLATLSPDQMAAARDADSFDVYNDLKAKLIDKGIDEKAIAFIHDAKTDAQKEALFRRVNRGEVRVLLGSTGKMGAGMNVQERLVALHHLDAPWRPSDLEQREGRILRQGNKLYERDPDGFEVRVMRYATEKTYDARMWQTIESKARTISQYRNATLADRRIEDVAGEAANAADMKAAASGNPMILEEVELRSDIKRLQGLKRAHTRSQHELENRVRDLKNWQANGEGAIARLQGDVAKRDANTTDDFNMTVNGKGYTKSKDAGNKLMLEFAKFLKEPNTDSTGNVAEYRGFPISFFKHRLGGMGLYLHGDAKDYVIDYRPDDKLDGRGAITRVDNRLNGIGEQVEARRALMQRQGEEYAATQDEIGKPFAGEAELADKEARHKQVVKELTEENKPEDDDAPKLSRSREPAYIELERTLATRLPKRGRAKLMIAHLRGLIKKGVIDDNEVEQAGLIDWLKDQPGTLTRPRVLDYLSDTGRDVIRESGGYDHAESAVPDAYQGGAATTRTVGQIYDRFGEPFTPSNAQAHFVAYPLTRAEAETLLDSGVRNVFRFSTRGPETTGEQGWFYRGGRHYPIRKTPTPVDTILTRSTRREPVEFGSYLDMRTDANGLRHGRAAAWYKVAAPGTEATPRTPEGGPLLSRSSTELVFYSQMRRVLADKLPGKGSPAQIKQAVDAFARKGQIKQEELEWSGLGDWLDRQGGKVTKRQVLDFLHDNAIQIHDVMLADMPNAEDVQAYLKRMNAHVRKRAGRFVAVVDGRDIDAFDTQEQAREYLRASARRHEEVDFRLRGRQTQYSNYRTPGGEDYRELLLTLPNRGRTSKQLARDMFDSDLSALNQEQLSAVIDATRAEPSNPNYRAPHFDERNLLAHVRFNTRAAPDGERVLHLEEVQSDWHQMGRKKGYQKPPLDHLPQGSKLTLNDAGKWVLTDADGDYIGSTGYDSFGNSLTKAEATQSLLRDLNQRRAAPPRVPDAPFKTTWPMLVMKRMIRYAAENGYDRITWTTGEQQAARYNLSAVADEILWGHGPNGIRLLIKTSPQDFEMEVDKASGKITSVGYNVLPGADDANLKGVVGKELAERIMREPHGDVKGQGLEVGGQGMRTFYDQILPKALNKYVKKWGATVSDAAIEVNGRPETVHAVDVTPAMRDSVLAGQPLFSRDSRGRMAVPEVKAGEITKQRAEETITADWIRKLGARASRGSRDRSQTPETLRRTLKRTLGDDFDTLEHADKIRIVFSENELPPKAQFSGARGWFDGERVWLVAGNIPRGRELGVLLHEAGHASVDERNPDLKSMLGLSFDALTRHFDKLHEKGDPIARRAAERAEAESTTNALIPEERLTYFAEEAASAQRAGTLRGSAKLLYRRVVAALRAWFVKTPFAKKLAAHGIELSLKPDDFVALARQAVRQRAREVDDAEALRPAPIPEKKLKTASARLSKLSEEDYARARTDEAKRRERTFFDAIKEGKPIDQAFAAAFHVIGRVDEHGRWRLPVSDKRVTEHVTGALNTANRMISTGRFSFLHPMLERAKAGLIDRYGLPEAYNARDFRRVSDQRAMLLEARDIFNNLVKHGVDVQEAKVLQQVLTGEVVDNADMAALAAPIREAIDRMGAEAVELGMLDRATYERNRQSYLHRSYLKHEADTGRIGRGIESLAASRRKTIHGKQFKRRGLAFAVDGQARLLRDAPDDWWGRKHFRSGVPDATLEGSEWTVYDLWTDIGEHNTQLDVGEGGPRGRKLRRIYWPADREPPAAVRANYVDRGTFRLETGPGRKLTLARDFTKAERQKMGEILDARYNITKTYQLMAHDLATGRFFRDIAENPDWSRADEPPVGTWTEVKGPLALYTDFEWVRVPNTRVEGTRTKRWGQLAGRYVRADIWRDLNELRRMQSPGVWRKLLSLWKQSKTSMNPTVHMNNVMSNFMLMDLMDVRVQDLARGLYAYTKRDADYQDALTHGAFGGDFVTQELGNEILRPILDEVSTAARHDPNSDRMGLMHGIQALYQGVRKGARFMGDAYRVEDEVFRMAAYMRRRDEGDSTEMAALQARRNFIDYDIRAPWVNFARQTFLPFISYTYRAAPLIAEGISDRPWKLAKYATVAALLNGAGYALDSAGGDEDRERHSIREQISGYTWLGVPRMMRLPFHDGNGDPMYLDIRRWIPGGDIFDIHQGHSAVPLPAPLMPGGPLVIAGELLLNRDSFTGDPLVNELTDTGWDRTRKLAGWAWRSLAPSAPWVPGSWYWRKIKNAATGARDVLGRRYSVPLALTSSIGIKLRGQDIDLNYQYKAWHFKDVRQELERQMRQLERDHARGFVSDTTYQEHKQRLLDKMNALVKKERETFKYAQPSSSP